MIDDDKYIIWAKHFKHLTIEPMHVFKCPTPDWVPLGLKITLTFIQICAHTVGATDIAAYPKCVQWGWDQGFVQATCCLSLLFPVNWRIATTYLHTVASYNYVLLTFWVYGRHIYVGVTSKCKQTFSVILMVKYCGKWKLLEPPVMEGYPTKLLLAGWRWDVEFFCAHLRCMHS